MVSNNRDFRELSLAPVSPPLSLSLSLSLSHTHTHTHTHKNSFFINLWNPVASSVEYLPFNSAARVRFSAGSAILISIMELGVFFVFCPMLCLAEGLTFCWPLPYRHLTHGHLCCKFRRVLVVHWGRVNNRCREEDFVYGIWIQNSRLFEGRNIKMPANVQLDYTHNKYCWKLPTNCGEYFVR